MPSPHAGVHDPVVEACEADGKARSTAGPPRTGRAGSKPSHAAPSSAADRPRAPAACRGDQGRRPPWHRRRSPRIDERNDTSSKAVGRPSPTSHAAPPGSHSTDSATVPAASGSSVRSSARRRRRCGRGPWPCWPGPTSGVRAAPRRRPSARRIRRQQHRRASTCSSAAATIASLLQPPPRERHGGERQEPDDGEQPRRRGAAGRGACRRARRCLTRASPRPLRGTAAT